MNFLKQLFGKKPIPAHRTSKASLAAGKVDPRSMTHIIMIVDKSEPIPNIRETPNEVYRIWSDFNTGMTQVLTSAGLGIPCYYVEGIRKDSSGQLDFDHLAAHLDKLYVPPEHSSVAQFMTLKIAGRLQDVTLQTIVRSDERHYVISEKQLLPHVA